MVHELGSQQLVLLARRVVECCFTQVFREPRDAAGVPVQRSDGAGCENMIVVSARASGLVPQIVLQLSFAERRERRA